MSNTAFSQTLLHDIIARHGASEGPLLPVLHDIMAQFQHIPDDAVAPLAEALGLTRAEVHGVVSFYHDFKTRPNGHHVIQLCRAEACQSVGAAGRKPTCSTGSASRASEPPATGRSPSRPSIVLASAPVVLRLWSMGGHAGGCAPQSLMTEVGA